MSSEIGKFLNDCFSQYFRAIATLLLPLFVELLLFLCQACVTAFVTVMSLNYILTYLLTKQAINGNFMPNKIPNGTVAVSLPDVSIGCFAKFPHNLRNLLVCPRTKVDLRNPATSKMTGSQVLCNMHTNYGNWIHSECTPGSLGRQAL